MAFFPCQAQGFTLVRAELALHAESFVHDGDFELTGLRANQAFCLASVFAELPKHGIGHSVSPPGAGAAGSRLGDAETTRKYILDGGLEMANRTKPTLEKRAKERARQEKRKQKDERRASAKALRANSPRRAGDEDPDIAGITPGPQPSPWGDEEGEA